MNKLARTIFFILVLTMISPRALAYDISNPTGGRSAAMGRTSACSRGLWAIQNNPAGLSQLKDIAFGAYYENRWFTKATGFKSAAFAMSFDKAGTIGVSFNQFGYELYNENKLGIAYAKGFGQYIQIGIQLDYLFLKSNDDYGRQDAITFELGLQSHITDKLTLGTYLFNPVSFKMHTFNDAKIPTVFRFGIDYQFTKNFSAQCEIEKDTSHKGVSLRAGLEYEVIKDLFIRAGAQSNPGVFTFGIGYEIKFFQINIAAQLHSKLGASLQAGAIFSFNRK